MKREKESCSILNGGMLFDNLLISIRDRFADAEEEVGWREKMADRMLPLLREINRITQWGDAPLKTDSELLNKQIAALRRDFPTKKALDVSFSQGANFCEEIISYRPEP